MVGLARGEAVRISLEEAAGQRKTLDMRLYEMARILDK